MRFIDLSTWDRAMHYQAFRNSVQPQYCVTFDLDITNFLPKIKAKGYSFTFAFVYAVTKCANQIEAFRCRFVDGKPAVLDTVNTSFTYLKKGTELFKVVNVPMQDSMEEYVSYRHISHTDSGNKNNATPLFDWGKFYKKDGKILLPFSVQVHHSFVDGIHIGKLAELLQNYLSNFS